MSINRRLAGLQGPCGRLRKISPLSGFIHRTVQPVASLRYPGPRIERYCNLITLRVSRKGLEIIKGTRVPVSSCQTQMPAETRVLFDLRRHSNWPHACHHNFQTFVSQKCVLYHKFVVLLETPDKHSLIFAVIPSSHRSALNIPNIPITRNPQASSMCCAGQLTEPPCLTRCPPKAWFRRCLKMRRKWRGVPSCRIHLCCRW